MPSSEMGLVWALQKCLGGDCDSLHQWCIETDSSPLSQLSLNVPKGCIQQLSMLRMETMATGSLCNRQDMAAARPTRQAKFHQWAKCCHCLIDTERKHGGEGEMLRAASRPPSFPGDPFCNVSLCLVCPFCS